MDPGRVNKKFNLYEGYPGVAPQFMDPESFVRAQQRGPYSGRYASPERLSAMSEAAMAYRGMGGPRRGGMGLGASFGGQDDALRRLLQARMGAI